MPYPVNSALAELGSERHVTKKSSDFSRMLDTKKTESSTRQENEEKFFAATMSDASPPKHFKKTGIPRVKAKPLEKRLSPEEKREERRGTNEKTSADDKGKKAGSMIIEKTPNKKAQRTKGSTAIGRIPTPAAKSRPASSAVHISRPVTREEDYREDVQTPSGKFKSLKKASRSRIKVAIKDSKEEDGINVQSKKSSWLLEKSEERKKMARDGESQRPSRKVSENPIEVEKAKDSEMAKTYIPPMPSSTCSLFEKIQQSVRSYFTSKSTVRAVVTPEELPKNKTNLTEGGITVGLLGEVIKEEPMKRRAKVLRGDKKHSKIYVKRVNKKLFNRTGVFAGGRSHSISLFDAKRNIYRQFWEMKRKKLYNPKKHYVRIQIPRKGYFYRSHVYHRASSLLPARLESDCVQKNESKIQIARLAASGPASTDIREKRVKAGAAKKKKSIKSCCEMNHIAYPKGSLLRERDFGQRNGYDVTNFWSPREYLERVFSYDNSNNKMISLQFDRENRNDGSLNLNRKFFESDSEFRVRNSSAKSTSMETNSEIFKKRQNHQHQNEFSDRGFYIFETVKNLAPCSGDNVISVEPHYADGLAWTQSSKHGSSTEEPTLNMQISSKSHDNYQSQANNSLNKNSLPKSCPNEADDYKNLYKAFMADIDFHLELENYLKASNRNEAISDGFYETKLEQIEKDPFPCYDYVDEKSVIESIERTHEVGNPAESMDHSMDGDMFSFVTPLEVISRRKGTENLKINSNPFQNLENYKLDLLNDESGSFEHVTCSEEEPSEEDDKMKWIITNSERKYLQNPVHDDCIKTTLSKTVLSSPKTDFHTDNEEAGELTSSEFSVILSTPVSISTGNKSLLMNQYEKLKPMKTNLNLCQKLTAIDDIDAEVFNIKPIIKGKIINSFQPMFLHENTADFSKETVIAADKNDLDVQERSSIEELLKIHKSIQKEWKKSPKNYKKPSNHKETSSLLSFVDDLLKARKNNSELTRLPRIGGSNLSQSSPNFTRYFQRQRNKIESKQNFLTLEEYVNVVQQMLSSGLSLQQISMLNNITAKLQQKKPASKSDGIKRSKASNNSNSNKVSKRLKDSNAVSGRSSNTGSTVTSKSKNVLAKKKSEIKNHLTLPFKKSESIPTLKSNVSFDHLVLKGRPLEEIKNIELSTPEMLESLIKSQFHLQSNLLGEESMVDKKLVVTVKLSDEKIIVNGIDHVDNENFLRETHRSGETSDLIIESIRGKQLSQILINKTGNENVAAKKPKRSSCPGEKVSGKEGPILSVGKTKSIQKDVCKKKNFSKRVEKRETRGAETINFEKAATPIGDFLINKNQKFVRFNKKSILKSLYDYDQQKLKAQHPIEAIMESSESKIDELSCEGSEDLCQPPANNHIQDKYIVLDDSFSTKYTDKVKVTKEKAVKRSKTRRERSIQWNYGKDLTSVKRNKLNAFKLNRTKSYVLGIEFKVQHANKSRANKYVKSLEDTSFTRHFKTPDFVEKVSRKKIQMRSSNFCYLVSPEFIRSSKEKKEKRNRNESRRSINVEGSKESKIFNKKSSKNLKNISPAMMADYSSGALAPEDSSIEIKENFNGSVENCFSTPFNNFGHKHQKPSDDGMVKFLYSDSRKSNVSQDSSESEEPFKIEKDGKINNVGELESYLFNEPVVKTSERSIESNNSRQSPIFIHPPRTENLEISFPSLMIHSDSFLMSRSTFILSKNNFKRLFKSNSDMKFFPGRVIETGEKDQEQRNQQRPFVTFVLTPKQKAVAGVPSEQVQVIFPNALTSANCNNSEMTESNEPSIEQQKKILQSIEEFMNILPKFKIKESTNKSKKKVKRPEKFNKKMAFNNKTKAEIEISEMENNGSNAKLIQNYGTGNRPSFEETKNLKSSEAVLERSEPNDSKLSDDNSKSCIPALESQQSNGTSCFDGNGSREDSTVPESLSKIVSKSSETIFKSLDIQTDDTLSWKNYLTEQVEKISDSWITNLKNRSSSSSNNKLKTNKVRVRYNAKKSQSEEINTMIKRKRKKRSRLLQATKVLAIDKMSSTKGKIKDSDKPMTRKLSLTKTPSVYFDAASEAEFEISSKTDVEENGVDDRVTLDNRNSGSSSHQVARGQIPLTSSHEDPHIQMEWDIEEKILSEIMKNLQIENSVPALIFETIYKILKGEEEKQWKDLRGNLESNLKGDNTVPLEQTRRSELTKVLPRVNRIGSSHLSNIHDLSISSKSGLSGKILRMSAILDYLEKQVSNARTLMTDIKILADENSVGEKNSESLKRMGGFRFSEIKSEQSHLLGEDFRNGILSKLKDSIRYLKNRVILNQS